MENHTLHPKITCRKFLGLVGLGMGALGSCGLLPSAGREQLPSIPRAYSTGRVQEYAFEYAPLELELGGSKVQT